MFFLGFFFENVPHIGIVPAGLFRFIPDGISLRLEIHDEKGTGGDAAFVLINGIGREFVQMIF